MPQLQTQVEIQPPNFSIDYTDKILLLGSCFSTNIGSRLEYLKFQTLTNPFGVLYNPASVSQGLNLLLDKKRLESKDLNYHNDLWFSFYHHSSFSHPDKDFCLKNINGSLKIAENHLNSSSYIFITLGTAWAFKNKITGEIVANCHKIPAKEFTRIYLNPDEIVRQLSEPINKLTKINSQVKFILTVSPIRHWKDGAIENMRSKSSLLLAIKELEESFQNIYYFPVYEIFMDELRDYRFYASDMLHPSEFAIEYIWEYFASNFFSENTRLLAVEVEKLVKSFQHRPMNTKTETFKTFAQKLNQRAQQISSKHPSIAFSEELKKINSYFV